MLNVSQKNDCVAFVLNLMKNWVNNPNSPTFCQYLTIIKNDFHNHNEYKISNMLNTDYQLNKFSLSSMKLKLFSCRQLIEKALILIFINRF